MVSRDQQSDDAGGSGPRPEMGDPPAGEYDPDRLTWAVLLSQWTQFARSSMALPDTDEGRAMKRSVADLIMLQAVWFALQQIDGLALDERALGLDRAGVLIDQHAGALEQRWGEEMPELMSELIHEAREQLAVAKGDER